MAIITFLLTITIWNYDTGDKLWELTQTVKVHNIKECYKEGVDYILPIINGIRTYIPNASANVSCRPQGSP